MPCGHIAGPPVPRLAMPRATPPMPSQHAMCQAAIRHGHAACATPCQSRRASLGWAGLASLAGPRTADPQSRQPLPSLLSPPSPPSVPSPLRERMALSPEKPVVAELPCHKHAICPGWVFEDIFRLTEAEEVSIKRGLANYTRVKYTDSLNGSRPFAEAVGGIQPYDPDAIKKRFEEFTTCKLDSGMDAKLRATKMEATRPGAKPRGWP